MGESGNMEDYGSDSCPRRVINQDEHYIRYDYIRYEIYIELYYPGITFNR